MQTSDFTEVSYQPRIIDSQLKRVLSISPAVLIEGPRGCGKTMSAINQAESVVFVDDPNTQKLLEVDPYYLLDGAQPHLIDEWQLYPQVWNQVRRNADAGEGFGQFILTGSAVPADDITRHTGAGRVVRVRERTMTWSEKTALRGLLAASDPAADNGNEVQPVAEAEQSVAAARALASAPQKVSLRALFNGDAVSTDSRTYSYGQVLELLLTSGFPRQVGLAPHEAQEALLGYAEEIVRTDLGRIADLRVAPVLIEQVIVSLARLSAAEARIATVYRDALAVAPAVTEATVARIVNLLERLFVVEKVAAWAPRLRSRGRLRTSPKYHLMDPAFAAAVLRAGREALLADPETAGFLFESAVVHDLSVMAESLGGRVCHYRDSNGHEIDAVIELNDGRWAAVEVKLGAGQIEAGARSLARAVAQIEHARPPAFMAVVTGTGMSYTMPEGIHTFPLAALEM